MSHPQLPSGVRAEEITTSRLATHVLEAGSRSAPALILVHGNVSAAVFFAPIMAELADQFHCIAPDLRGFGRSEPRPVDARRGLRDFSDDVHALLAETDLVPDETPLVLLGWSLGGGVVLQYAIDHPGAARALVLESPMSPFGFGGTRDAAGVPCYPGLRRVWRRHGQPGDGGRRLGAGDRTNEDLVSPRRVLTNLYFQPPFDRGYQRTHGGDGPATPPLCCLATRGRPGRGDAGDGAGRRRTPARRGHLGQLAGCGAR